MAKRWTVDEIDYLKDKYGVTNDEAIARYLDKSINAVSCKAQKLGLRKRDALSYVTVSDFCTYTNISRSTVGYWISNCELPTRKFSKYRKNKYR